MTLPTPISQIEPNVDPTQSNGPNKKGQRRWIQGTNLLIGGLAIVFILVILGFALTR